MKTQKRREVSFNGEVEVVIHSVHVGVLLRSSLAGEGVSNRGVASGEKEGIEYFVAGSQVCVTPK